MNMTLLPFHQTQDTLAPRGRSDLARDEQAFYDKYADAQSWKSAFKHLGPIALGLVLYAGFLGLVLR